MKEAEEKVLEGLTESEIEEFIYEIVENSEILPEILQQYRYVPKRNKSSGKVEKQEQMLNKQKNIDIYKNAYQYKQILNCINEQIKCEKHPLFIIKEDFLKYFLQSNKNPADFSSTNQSQKQMQEQEIQNYIKEIKAFVNFFIGVIKAYYNLDEIVINSQSNASSFIYSVYEQQNQNLYQQKQMGWENQNQNQNFISQKSFEKVESFVNQENLTNFVTSLLFQNSSFFNMVFQVFSMIEGELQFNFQKNMVLLQNSKPEVFGINAEFQLNDKTINYIYEELQQKQKENLEEYNLQNKEKNQSFMHNLQQDGHSNENSSQNQNQDQNQNQQNSQKPYQICIDKLIKLRQQKEPIKMLKVLIDTSEGIKQSIQDFYSKESEKIKQIEKNLIQQNISLKMEQEKKLKEGQIKGENLQKQEVENEIENYKQEQKQQNKEEGEIFQLNFDNFNYNSIKQKYEDYFLSKVYDGDHFLSLFVYFVVTTQIKELYVYLQIVRSFVHRNSKFSISGYLMITIESCVHYIAGYQKSIKKL
ncbi:hypothetical protein PPERSA_07716 [Pseudocohnilembus persalinus]|uniref:VPS9 domain-containing protein n=1 Tax=Pseudocohnilembus persalinus TaxID=266149 RepID=A0A0V0R9M8_PSEPJ|nr:hypothetical protein PPERSA_07716 [Pseudocohnilembus persalinus]|eukprot:KRX11191.1 hypothetical protein PPERSA_07716 [Pseudocohnilembus persalinus]